MRDGETHELPVQKTQQLPRTIAIRQTRRIVIAIVGGLLIGAGLVGILLPIVPGWLLIIPGLTILSWEFYWARKLLDTARARLRAIRNARRARRSPPESRQRP